MLLREAILPGMPARKGAPHALNVTLAPPAHFSYAACDTWTANQWHYDEVPGGAAGAWNNDGPC